MFEIPSPWARVTTTRQAGWLAFLAAVAGTLPAGGQTTLLQPRVEVEEEVYHYKPANNGAGPMWCHGNTCVVRMGDWVFASGLETISAAKPLNNCLPMLFTRNSNRWERIYQGEK